MRDRTITNDNKLNGLRSLTKKVMMQEEHSVYVSFHPQPASGG